ncbi:MAG: PadR family transcriptional regulator [Oscillospiraceae bacterium]|jgi:PadR family transcriptional regulator PadR|nr:PadR family transcriptional regulator [Oscillospiraceae bacterium]
MQIQFKKGVLELCVLAMLKNGDRYGYDVANCLSNAINVSDGSVYPVLRRLKQEGCVSSYLEEASGGPPRKYYVITNKGTELLDSLVRDWSSFSGHVNNILTREGNLQ